ncbi:MAG: putative quinol monooxygenase [Rubrivivax sp.]|nr:putative quinol monooxygenase [Rubrivivax sp.]
MLVVVVKFHIHPAHVQAFRQAIVANATQSLATEPGCRQFDVCCDPADPTLVFLYEVYDDESAFQVHLQSAHFVEMNVITADWVSSKQIWRYTRIAPLARGTA